MPAARLDFANQLRGLAALLVAVSHLLGVYWAMRGYVAAATFSPVQPGPTPAVFRLIAWKWFELGPFGVALFFLISGLVIPFSLRHHTRLSFLAARILRIYPTFILAIGLEMLLLYAASRYWGIPFAYTPRILLFQCLLASNLAGTPVVDFVSWTLALEMKFYLLVTLLAPWIRLGRLGLVVGVAVALAAAELLLAPYAAAGHSAALAVLCDAIPYLVFMLAGVPFYFHHTGLIGGLRFVAGLAATLAAFAVAWRFGVLRASFTIVAVNYGYALVLFAGLYALRRRIRANRLFDGIAAISYPFYLVHPIVGFTVIKLAMLRWHLGYLPALALALAAIVAVAIPLHVTVERWTVAAGRRLGQRATKLSLTVS